MTPNGEVKAIHLTGRERADQYIITFPGGSIELARLDDGTYWAHIARERAGNAPPEEVGVFLSGRMDSEHAVAPLPIAAEQGGIGGIYHIAVRVAKAVRS